MAYLAHVRDVEVEIPPLESIPLVSKFGKVIPNLLGLPPDRVIDLETGTRPICFRPYCMATTKLKELKAQIQELLNK